jgi:hypothetical protein
MVSDTKKIITNGGADMLVLMSQTRNGSSCVIPSFNPMSKTKVSSSNKRGCIFPKLCLVKQKGNRP